MEGARHRTTGRAKGAKRVNVKKEKEGKVGERE
jgi:hypothetical protein